MATIVTIVLNKAAIALNACISYGFSLFIIRGMTLRRIVVPHSKPALGTENKLQKTFNRTVYLKVNNRVNRLLKHWKIQSRDCLEGYFRHCTKVKHCV